MRNPMKSIKTTPHEFVDINPCEDADTAIEIIKSFALIMSSIVCADESFEDDIDDD